MRPGSKDRTPAFAGPFMTRVVGKHKRDDSFTTDGMNVSKDMGSGFYLVGKVKIPHAKKSDGGVPELYYNDKR